MRVGIDIRYLPRDNRGMGRYVRGMLAALFAARTDDRFVLAHDRCDASAVAGLLSTLGVDERVQAVDAAEFARMEVDLSWHPWNRVDLLPRSGRVAVTIHDLAPMRFARKSVLNLLDDRRAEQRILNAMRRADLILTVSKTSAKEIRDHAPDLTGEIAVIYPGVDPAFLSPSAESDHPAPEDYILFVGADDERKNISRLIQAFALLRKDLFPGLSLVLCGTGMQAVRKYKPVLHAAGLNGEVSFLDRVSDHDLRALYAGARALVFPSRYEGFGLPVLEAMACGIPVVCSNTSSMPEVAGDAALLCDPGNPVDIAEKTARCIKDETLRAELIRRGWLRVQGFTWETSAEALMQAFRKLVEGRR